MKPGGYREVLKIAYPLILSMGSFTVMQFVDRVFLAWFSDTAIQAALPGGILSFTLICGFMALAGYANTFVAQYHGAGDQLGCSRATAQGVLLALVSWPVMIALVPIGEGILRHSGHPPSVVADEVVYFRILLIGGVSAPLSAAISSFYTGRGDTMTNLWANVAANAVNIALDYALIFGNWGAPRLGIQGAAWSSMTAAFVAPAIMFALYFRRKVDAEFETRRTFRFDRPLMERMIRFGLPSAAHLVLDVGSFTLFVLLIGRLGNLALSASNIALSINNIAFMPLIGMSIAASILVGQYQGRQDGETAARAGWTSVKIGWIYMAAIALTFVLFPGAYFRLFQARGHSEIPLDQLLPLGRILLGFLAAWGMLDVVNLILSGALKGAGDTRFVMIYSVAMAWGFWIVGELILLFVFHAGLIAAWAWMTAYVMLMAIGFIWRYVSGRWKTIDLIERATPIQPHGPGAEGLSVVD